MYKLLLCSRYLRTRYIALASIISVTLGVATMIVVNSVMSGFQSEMYKRLHGILSDVVVEAQGMEGIQDPLVLEQEIRSVVGDDLLGLTNTVHVPALLSYQWRGQWMQKQINLIGIDRETYAHVSDFSQYLLHPENREQISFDLRTGGYDERLQDAGWDYRRLRSAQESYYRQQMDLLERDAGNAAHPDNHRDLAAAGSTSSATPTSDTTADESFGDFNFEGDHALDAVGPQEEPTKFDPSREQHVGIVLGIATSSIRHRMESGEVVDVFLCRPGDDVKVTLPTAGTPPQPVHANFTVVDFYESKMSEYDAGFAFVPIEELQHLRGMFNMQTGMAAVNSIQLKLRPGVDLNAVRDRLRERFPAELFPYRIQTWMDLQGPLLAAVQMETTILNILLFLIIAV
ncbi:MAG: ABC transporter permease, partial [Planctomycetales bacterium]|nr:ABC transporter permease [Planctomycetales bacterium]